MYAKRLFLIRHAKSSWKDASLSDHERPLNKRGELDAPFMGKLLKKKNVIPDLIISSHAKRSKVTANLICNELHLLSENIIIDKKLYEAEYNDIIEVIKETSEDVQTLLVFGHNPGFTTLHNFLCDTYIDNIPTCGITEYEFEGNWKEISAKSCRLLSFEFPKKK
ncbi:MAG: histidine phosphatase family protein [Ignavibacteriaceae bacterium]|nr:histidine phosphatase family protein [Ignavibacteriaceae bacterium]